MSRKSVSGGFCSEQDYGRSGCALEKLECSSEQKFYSSRQIQAPGYRSSCSLPNYVRKQSLKQCADGTCSPNNASCTDLGLYDMNDTKTCLVENTLFGRCGDRCLWSPDDCVNETWKFPSQLCSCDQVQVGACKKDNQIFCAVSPAGCDDLSTWISPIEIKFTTDIRCFLCREKTVPFTHYPVAVDNIEPSPTRAPSGAGVSENTIGAFVGGVVGGVAGATMVLFLFNFLRNRQTLNTEAKAPLTFIDISKNDEDVSAL